MHLDLPKIDYLVVGHVAKDLSPDSYQLGGTVSYSGRTAMALGLRVGAVTSASPELSLQQLEGMHLVRIPSEKSTTFKNRSTPTGREQQLSNLATELGVTSIPTSWLETKIVHLGPIAREVELDLIDRFPTAFIGITPQGWLRRWDQTGKVWLTSWREVGSQVARADAVVVSIEDLNGDETEVAALAQTCSLLSVTRGPGGATVFIQGEPTDLEAVQIAERDATGAGDIFAAVFFIQLANNMNPLKAGRIANWISAQSVARVGMEAIPTTEEIHLAFTRASQ
jgi:hypothetical protein